MIKREDLEIALKHLKQSEDIIDTLYKEIRDADSSEDLDTWTLANNLETTLWRIRDGHRELDQAIEWLTMMKRKGERDESE